jgi:hypothetical protein
MIEVYNILNEKYDQDACTILKLWKDMAPRSSIRRTSLKLYPQRARTQLRKYSFAMRVAKYWNSLPEKIVTIFQCRIQRFLYTGLYFFL